MRGDVPSFVSAMTGNLFVVSAPSGAGKSSLVSAVLAEDKRLALSVSFTTRPPRSGEVNGREYHFVDGMTFEKMLGRGEFLESAQVHGNRYGTSRKWIGESRAKGLDVVLEIDWQGARQVRKAFPDAVSIFILPPIPVLPELERRLRARGQDTEEAIQRRLHDAREEISHVGEFDYVIINKEFEEARRDLAAIVQATRLTLARQNADRLRGQTHIRIGCGSLDGLLPRNKELHDLLTELRIEHEYEIVPDVVLSAMTAHGQPPQVRPKNQFVPLARSLLAPLALMSRRDTRLAKLLRSHIDGIPLDLASSLLPISSWWRFALLIHLHLHAKSQKAFADRGTTPQSSQ